MDSFDGGRRRDPRSPLPPAERRALRDGEPLEQRLDRWMSTGRQLVEGVSGGRPGTRQGGRRPDGRPGSRGGFDGLGRWVEDRLDWLLDDSDDWPEPWQENERRRGEPPAPSRAGQTPEPDRARARSAGSRRPLQAISRRGGATVERAAPGAAAMPSRPAPARGVLATPASAGSPHPANGGSDAGEEWPDAEAFSVPRWQRPSAPLQRPDPLQTELEQRSRERDQDGAPPPAAPARPLPRSSRRR
jgi:hypothetical protein